MYAGARRGVDPRPKVLGEEKLSLAREGRDFIPAVPLCPPFFWGPPKQWEIDVVICDAWVRAVVRVHTVPVPGHLFLRFLLLLLMGVFGTLLPCTYVHTSGKVGKVAQLRGLSRPRSWTRREGGKRTAPPRRRLGFSRPS